MNDLSIIGSFAVAILSVINPVGSVPLFLSLTSNFSDEEIVSIARTCAVTIVITLSLSVLFGEHILAFFGVSIPAFRVSGGILIGAMAFSMLQAKTSEQKLSKREIQKHVDINEVGIVPLAIPLLAGPGAISTSILSAQKFGDNYVVLGGALLALCIIGLLLFFIMSFSRKIALKLGRVGINVMTRVMGLILMAIAVEFVANGLKVLLPGLD